MNKVERVRFLIITLIVACLFELFLILGGIDIINDKNAYINGLLSDRNICNDKLDGIIQDYAKIDNELQDYKRINGELDE